MEKLILQLQLTPIENYDPELGQSINSALVEQRAFLFGDVVTLVDLLADGNEDVRQARIEDVNFFDSLLVLEDVNYKILVDV